MTQHPKTVAFVGNPNAGKTTLFNCLTGSHQKVGNYPGVTVEKVSGILKLEHLEVECIDVPGAYSLEPVSEDERVAVDVMVGHGHPAPDLFVYVLDAGNLERNLFMFTQLAELEVSVVVALTMTDVAARRGVKVDAAKLANLLGVDVVPVVGHRGIGVNAVKEAIERNLEAPKPSSPSFGLPIEVETKVAALGERFARSGVDLPKAEIRRALQGAADLTEQTKEIPELAGALREAKEELEGQGVLSASNEVSSRYQWATMVSRAVTLQPQGKKPESRSDKIDWFLTHRFFGLATFVLLMYGIFQAIYTLAKPLMTLISGGFDSLSKLIEPLLAGSPILQSLVVKGLITGVGTMLTFLPQIMILFFFISVLEGTGYLARAAFLMDKLLGWCGLNGRAFIPLLSSFACAVPGIMSARVMPDAKSRLATILIAPLMSCSARLPIYLVLIGAFIEPKFGAGWAGFTLFAMHLLGLVVAIPVVFVLNRRVIKTKKLPFLLELPPYQWPKWRDVWLAIFFRAKVFVNTAGTIIVTLSIVIWACLYFPRSSESIARFQQDALVANPSANAAQVQNFVDARLLEQSILGRLGKTIEPVFIPAGFDWRLTTAILAAFPAREVVVAELGIVFYLGGDVDETNKGLNGALQSAKWPDGRTLVTPWTAVGLMVFFALCCQCMATLAAVKRETNSWRWAAFMFTYMTVLAYLGAVLVHQLEKLFT